MFFYVCCNQSVKALSIYTLTLSCRTIYMSYRTANLQMLHFIYLFNKYAYRIF